MKKCLGEIFMTAKVKAKIIHNQDKCTGCGICVETCGVGMWAIKEVKTKDGKWKRKAVIVGDPEMCYLCHLCESKCGENAIQIIEEEVS
jgi:NAD-dependent dihydropyrimidine dehydrogenase PreA subunit